MGGGSQWTFNKKRSKMARSEAAAAQADGPRLPGGLAGVGQGGDCALEGAEVQARGASSSRSGRGGLGDVAGSEFGGAQTDGEATTQKLGNAVIFFVCSTFCREAFFWLAVDGSP